MNFLQGIAGTLELFHRSTLSFQEIVGEATGHPVAVYQRIDQAGFRLPIDERILDDTDTLMVFGLDHLRLRAGGRAGEIEALRKWLEREGTCLILAPHHDVGFTDDLEAAADGVPPPRRRAGAAAAAVRPVHPVADDRARRSGAESVRAPAGRCHGHQRDYAAHANRDLDTLGLLKGVTTFNFHLHLPHYAVTDDGTPRPSRPRAASRSTSTRPHPVHGGGETGVQLVPLDAAAGQTRAATSSWRTRRSSPRCSAARTA